MAGVGQQGGQSNLNNSATLNLRGLGPDATLTLIDGHRVAYDALDQGIDISAIPLAAVEQIEVVTDGASALYGSDAVGESPTSSCGGSSTGSKRPRAQAPRLTAATSSSSLARSPAPVGLRAASCSRSITAVRAQFMRISAAIRAGSIPH